MSKVESMPTYVITLSAEEFKSLHHLLAFNENRVKDTHKTLLPLYKQIEELSEIAEKKIVHLSQINGTK